MEGGKLATGEENVPSARERILEAALDLFSQKGFHATTTRKIAQEADVNEVTLFRHFSSKMDLFQEILNIVRQVGFNAEWLLELDLEPAESIRYTIEWALNNLKDHPRKFRILMYALLDRVEGFEDQFVKKQFEIGYEFLTRVFQKLKQLHRLRSDLEPPILATLLMTQIIATIQARNLFKYHPLRELSIKQISESITDLFIK